MQYEGKHYKRKYKHLKQEPKKRLFGPAPQDQAAKQPLFEHAPVKHAPKRRPRAAVGAPLMILLICVELMLTAAASYAVLFISWEHITERRTEYLTSDLLDFDTKRLTGNMSKFVKIAREQVSEEMDEQVWTTENVNYRVGPDESYDDAGSLSIYSGVKRTGVTYNDWSRVEIGDEDYYILSEYLTTEAPIITATGQKGEYQRYALMMLPNYGWEETEMYPLIKLWDRESHWNPSAHNRSSGAHGIPQALPASKMASEGSDYYTNGNTQIRWGLNYIKARYGSPSNAWAHSQSHGWY